MSKVVPVAVFRGLFVVASMLALAVPGVQAQNPVPRSVDFGAEATTRLGDDQLLDAEAELSETKLFLKVGCSATEPATVNLVATFEVKARPAFSRTVLNPASKSFKIDASSCTNTAYRERIETRLLLDVTRDAPALQTFNVTVAARLDEFGPTGRTATYGPMFLELNFTPDYLPLVNVQPARYFQLAPPGSKVVFPLDVFNIGNGETRTSFDVIPLGKNRLDAVIPPGTVVLESRVGRSDAAYKRWVQVEAVAPKADFYINEIFSFQLRVTSGSVDPRGTATDETVVTLSVQVQGGAGGAPAPPLLFVLAGVAVAVALGRRKPSP